MIEEKNGRTRCMIFTRVMGYLAPTMRYNKGKLSEFMSRKYFSKKKALDKCWYNKIANNEFTEKYLNK